jgi:hypothetical protein
MSELVVNLVVLPAVLAYLSTIIIVVQNAANIMAQVHPEKKPKVSNIK